MIQRIQTIFLLLGMVSWNVLFFKPMIGFTDETGGTWLLFIDAVRDQATDAVRFYSIPLLILVAFIDLLFLAAILSYKRRVLQLRITLFMMILQILSYAMVLLYVLIGKRELGAEPHLLFYSIMPVVAFIFSLLAFRGIRRDMLLLRSLDRLR